MVFLLTAMIVSTTGFVGCGGNSQQTQGSNAKMDKDQHLNLVLRDEPKSIDPSRATDRYSNIVITDTQEALTRCELENEKEVIKPAGAESWKTSEDGLTWTFKLRNNKWSDGQEVKAQDYEYSIKRTLDPNTASQYAYLLYPIKNAKEYSKSQVKAEDVGIKALDDKTLEIKLASPCAYFLKTTYFRVFVPERKDVVEKNGDKYGSDANTACSGPFVVKSWVHKNKMELEKNPNYWDKDKVKAYKVHLKIIPDTQARMNEIYNGSIDECEVEKKEWISKLDTKKDLTYVTGKDPSTDYSFFNTKDKLFSNVKVRQAFSLAIDRENQEKVLYPKTRKAFYAFCSPGIKIGDEEFRKKVGNEPLKKLKEQVKDPKALLSEGLKELGMDPDTSKLTVTISASGSGDANAKQMQELKQQNLQNVLGCKVKIDYMDWAIFQDKTRKAHYQLAAMAWSADYDDPMTMFDMWMTANADMNHTSWSNAKYDALIEKASKTMDQKVRFEAFKEAEEILVNEAPLAPEDYRIKTFYVKNYVKDIQFPSFGSPVEFKYAYTSGRDAN